jgi:hypothetical protein
VRLRGQNHEKLYSVRKVTADMFEQCVLVQRLERLEALERQLSERLERLEALKHCI